jgi:uncharacterized protein
MQLSRETNSALYQIQGYAEGSITINGKLYTESLLITNNQLLCPWGPSSVASLTTQHFQALLGYEPELVLLGTGKTLTFPPKEVFQALTQAYIGVEVMDTSAACRTYTLLASEGRGVVAALLL